MPPKMLLNGVVSAAIGLLAPNVWAEMPEHHHPTQTHASNLNTQPIKLNADNMIHSQSKTEITTLVNHRYQSFESITGQAALAQGITKQQLTTHESWYQDSKGQYWYAWYVTEQGKNKTLKVVNQGLAKQGSMQFKALE